MTGEVTLNGRVLPIGGVKQKLLAAQRAGLSTVFIPQRNEPDLDDVPAEVLEALDVRPMTDVAEIVVQALEPAESVSDQRGLTGTSSASVRVCRVCDAARRPQTRTLASCCRRAELPFNPHGVRRGSGHRIRELLGAQKGIEEKRMFGGLAFLINGNMSVAASGRGGLMVRVPPDENEPSC
jgi:hypothetical protein